MNLQNQLQSRKDLTATKHCPLIITGLLAFCLGVPVVRADEVPFNHADWKASPTDPVGFAGQGNNWYPGATAPLSLGPDGKVVIAPGYPCLSRSAHGPFALSDRLLVAGNSFSDPATAAGKRHEQQPQPREQPQGEADELNHQNNVSSRVDRARFGPGGGSGRAQDHA